MRIFVGTVPYCSIRVELLSHRGSLHSGSCHRRTSDDADLYGQSPQKPPQWSGVIPAELMERLRDSGQNDFETRVTVH